MSNNVTTDRLRFARLDAAGLCRTCAKAPRVTGYQRCADCLERARLGKANSIARTKAAEAAHDFCVDCIAVGFHRDGCEVAP